ncbi:MAG: hypothetical protein KDB27_02020 [Planctomycetales bacterium]|nr:hypothetical protein [Planctomycetales bacterium]
MTAKQQIVTKEYLGQWIAWNYEMTKIIASGRTFDEVKESAKDQGEASPVMEKVPRHLTVGATNMV